MKIILDMDNTMGASERDVDDGLTLMYLMGRGDVEILLITTTFGNDTEDVTYSNTVSMLRDLNSSVPVVKGEGKNKKPQENAAALKITECIEENPGIDIVALGSLHNLSDAEKLKPGLLRKAGRIISMGGIREDLFVDGISLSELNYSCDPEAVATVLKSGCNFINIGAHFCLSVRFGENEHAELMKDFPSYRYIREKCALWFDKFGEDYGNRNIVVWDLNCGVFATDPDLFTSEVRKVSYNTEDIKQGFLRDDEDGVEITSLTCLENREEYYSKIFSSWKRIFIKK